MTQENGTLCRENHLYDPSQSNNKPMKALLVLRNRMSNQHC